MIFEVVSVRRLTLGWSAMVLSRRLAQDGETCEPCLQPCLRNLSSGHWSASSNLLSAPFRNCRQKSDLRRVYNWFCFCERQLDGYTFCILIKTCILSGVGTGFWTSCNSPFFMSTADKLSRNCNGEESKADGIVIFNTQLAIWPVLNNSQCLV